MTLQNENYSLNVKFHVIHFDCQNLKGGFFFIPHLLSHTFSTYITIHHHVESWLVCMFPFSDALPVLTIEARHWKSYGSLSRKFDTNVCHFVLWSVQKTSWQHTNVWNTWQFPQLSKFFLWSRIFFMILYFESNSPSWQMYRKETVKCFWEKNPLIWIGHMHFKSSWHVKYTTYLKELWARQKHSLSAAGKILPGC